MTAREWLELRFPEAATGQFPAGSAGEMRAYGVPGAPAAPFQISYTAHTDLFLEWFGPTIQAALDTGSSVYDALMALPPDQERGWKPIFELWKRKGLLN